MHEGPDHASVTVDRTRSTIKRVDTLERVTIPHGMPDSGNRHRTRCVEFNDHANAVAGRLLHAFHPLLGSARLGIWRPIGLRALGTQGQGTQHYPSEVSGTTRENQYCQAATAQPSCPNYHACNHLPHAFEPSARRRFEISVAQETCGHLQGCSAAILFVRGEQFIQTRITQHHLRILTACGNHLLRGGR